MATPGQLAGIKDSRGFRGIFARGHARYAGPSKSPKPGNLFDIQRAAQNRLKKMKTMQGVGRGVYGRPT